MRLHLLGLTIAIVMVFVACGEMPVRVYSGPGGTASAYPRSIRISGDERASRDLRECTYDATRSLPVPQSADIIANMSRAQQQEDLIFQCMSLRGYR